MAKRLTKKQAKFVEVFAETGNATKSALAAYDTEDENTAANIGSENLQNVKIAKAIEAALSKEGISAEMIAKTLKRHITAKRQNYNQNTQQYYETDLDDYTTQDRAIGRIIDITGMKAPDKKTVKIQGVIAIDKIEEIRKRLFLAA